MFPLEILEDGSFLDQIVTLKKKTSPYTLDIKGRFFKSLKYIMKALTKITLSSKADEKIQASLL